MTRDIAQSAMGADIRRTPDVLRGLAERRAEFAQFRVRHLVPETGGTLHAFGCGDGLFAATAMRGDTLAVATALDFLLYVASRLTPRDRVLAISMSGNVDRTVAAAEAAIARGVPLAILTNGDGGRIGALGAPRLSLDVAAVKPFLCGTSSYTATLYALAMLLDVARGPEPAHAYDVSSRAMATLGTGFAGIRFLSAGANAGSAAYGAAKIVELCRVPAWHSDVEEFAHSQFWASDPAELIVYLADSPALAEIAENSAAALNGMGFRTLSIETADAPVPSAATRIVVGDIAEQLSPIGFAIPLQVLAWHVATSTGFDPDTRAHLKHDEQRFATSRKLTRKSLIGTGH